MPKQIDINCTSEGSAVPSLIVERVIDHVMGAANRIFGAEVWSGDPGLRADVRRHAHHFQNQLLRLVQSRSDRPRRRRRALYHVLGSFDGRFCALILGWPRNSEPIGLKAATKLAGGLNLRNPSGEAVHTWLEEKPEGGVRRLWSFGPKARAMQMLALLALQAIWGSPKFEFAIRGRGRDAALREIIAAMEKKGGPRWTITADIKDCFGSFQRDALIEILPLPRAVIENAILVPESVKIISEDSYTKDTSEIAAPHGLPQGSLASPYVASKLIERVLESVKSDFILAHVDDLFVGARSEKEASAILQHLGDLLEGHPAGPLLMKAKLAKLGRRIEYLSYHLRRRWLRYGGGVRLTPSSKAFSRFEARALMRMMKVPADDREAEARSYISQWSASHRLWDRSQRGDELVEVNVFAHVLPATYKKKSLYP